MKVAICLATYNGVKFLKEQIDSLLQQSYKDFSIYIADDNSTDDTISIIKDYVLHNDNIYLLEFDKPRHSACKNFLFLLDKVESDVYLFCDQDDVWDVEHVEKLVDSYQRLSEEEKTKPVLIHGDLSIVDENLKLLSKSGIKYMGLPKYADKHFYFVQNNVTGCVTLVNNELKKYIYMNRTDLFLNCDKIIMHDILCATIAKEFGILKFVDFPLEKYRQHSNNVLGASSQNNLIGIIKKAFSINEYKITYRHYKDVLSQYREYTLFFLEYFDKNIDLEEKSVLYQFATIQNKNKLSRILFLIRNKFLKYGLIRNIWLFIVV